MSNVIIKDHLRLRSKHEIVRAELDHLGENGISPQLMQTKKTCDVQFLWVSDWKSWYNVTDIEKGGFCMFCMMQIAENTFGATAQLYNTRAHFNNYITDFHFVDGSFHEGYDRLKVRIILIISTNVLVKNADI